MKLTELFHMTKDEPDVAPEKPMSTEETLAKAFALLTHRDEAVAHAISECLADTRQYYSAHGEILERRDLQYSPEAEPWLRVIAAVEACIAGGFLVELPSGCSPDSFSDAVKKVLSASGITFSPDRLFFDGQKSLAAWTRLFNEYAGQSGITLYFADLYGEGAVMGAARISDYAEAAEIAGFAGIRITCRPD